MPSEALTSPPPGSTVATLLEVWPDDLFEDAGPPVEVQGGELLRRVLADVLHVQVDDLGLGGQVG